MTSVEIYVSVKEGDPFGLDDPEWTFEQALKWHQHLEQVRQVSVEIYSKSPLYQRRAEKNPDYWKNFRTGRVNLY